MTKREAQDHVNALSRQLAVSDEARLAAQNAYFVAAQALEGVDERISTAVVAAQTPRRRIRKKHITMVQVTCRLPLRYRYF